jgi:hypothetical protein
MIGVMGMNWRALLLATLSFTISFAAWGLIGGLAPVFADLYGLSASQTALLVAVPVLLGSLARLPMGMLTDRYGGRAMFTIAANRFIFERSWRRRALADHVGMPRRRRHHVPAGLGMDPLRNGARRLRDVPHLRVRDRGAGFSRRLAVRLRDLQGMLTFVLILVVLQLWLLTATMNAYLGGDDRIVWPAAGASMACFLLNAGLLRYLYRLDRRGTDAS